MQSGRPHDSHEDIAKLGLEYNLMTQFTRSSLWKRR